MSARASARATGRGAGSGQLARHTVPTAPIAGGALIAGYAVAVASGSRALGGLLLVAAGLWCIQTWARRRGARTAAALAGVGFAALVLSHAIALLTGAWPAVLMVAAATAAAAWWWADADPRRRRNGAG